MYYCMKVVNCVYQYASICNNNSSICNNKQVWNGDPCRCDCNEDFAGIINCTK